MELAYNASVLMMDDSKVDDDYETKYFYFHDALVSLASNPSEQCRRRQYDNVAWFLKDDFLGRSNILLNSAGMKFSVEQLTHLAILLTLVGSIPHSITNKSAIAREQEAIMEDPSWVPIRQFGKALLELLEEETLRVRAILSIDDEG